jgi:hypothetical protein
MTVGNAQVGSMVITAKFISEDGFEVDIAE